MQQTELDAFLAVDRHLDDLHARLRLIADGKLSRLQRQYVKDAQAITDILRKVFRDVGSQAGVPYPE